MGARSAVTAVAGIRRVVLGFLVLVLSLIALTAAGTRVSAPTSTVSAALHGTQAHHAYSYDGTQQLSHPRSMSPTTAAGRPSTCTSALSVSYGTRLLSPSPVVAAEAGPRALPVGPWGQKVVDTRDKLPSAWGPGNPNAKGVGTRWSDPSAPQTNRVRLDEGLPGSGWPSQQVDHVVVHSGGRILGPDGKPIIGSLRENPQAHIPVSYWRNWTSWNAP